MSIKSSVTVAIISELQYQESRGSGWKNANMPSVGEELLLMEEYLHLARTAYTNNAGDEEALEVIRKVVGMGVRCMTNHGAPLRRV